MATGDYTTTALLKARLGITDTADDTILAAIITAVSRLIDDYAGRRFYAATETRYYTAAHYDRLLVDDLLSVTSLQTDPDGDGVYDYTWTANTDYALGPYNATLEAQPQPYWWLEVRPYGSYRFPAGVPRGVKLAGSFGFSSTTPVVIGEACLLACEQTYRQKDNPYGTIGGGEFSVETRMMTGAGLHPFVRRMLDPYRRVSAV